jgi:hypothetical protein
LSCRLQRSQPGRLQGGSCAWLSRPALPHCSSLAVTHTRAGEEGPELKAQLQTAFKNITRIMDCVGCEKCKLWGKLQTLGIATALKVLFSEQEAAAGSDASPAASLAALKLERNEVIALVNLLERLSKSIQIYWSLSQQLQQQEGVSPSVFGIVSR